MQPPRAHAPPRRGPSRSLLDPRRQNFDRHAAYVVVAFVAARVPESRRATTRNAGAEGVARGVKGLSRTVAEIAERAGLTERTFFRHFADKREVLFSGSAALQELLVERVAGAPDATSPIAAVGAALEAAGAVLQERGEWSQQRQAVIAANAELRERELIKLASLASALAEALRRRGVKEPVARLTAEAGIAAFKVAFERWVQRPSNRSLPRLIHESFDQLKAVAAGH